MIFLRNLYLLCKIFFRNPYFLRKIFLEICIQHNLPFLCASNSRTTLCTARHWLSLLQKFIDSRIFYRQPRSISFKPQVGHLLWTWADHLKWLSENEVALSVENGPVVVCWEWSDQPQKPQILFLRLFFRLRIHLSFPSH